MDISNLTYEELITLEKEIAKRKKELEKTKYENLVNGVLNAIKAIIEAGYSNRDACYNDDADWEKLLFEIQQEYERRKREDY